MSVNIKEKPADFGPEGLLMHFNYGYQYQKMEWTNKDVIILHKGEWDKSSGIKPLHQFGRATYSVDEP